MPSVCKRVCMNLIQNMKILSDRNVVSRCSPAVSHARIVTALLEWGISVSYGKCMTFCGIHVQMMELGMIYVLCAYHGVCLSGVHHYHYTHNKQGPSLSYIGCRLALSDASCFCHSVLNQQFTHCSSRTARSFLLHVLHSAIELFPCNSKTFLAKQLQHKTVSPIMRRCLSALPHMLQSGA